MTEGWQIITDNQDDHTALIKVLEKADISVAQTSRSVIISKDGDSGELCPDALQVSYKNNQASLKIDLNNETLAVAQCQLIQQLVTNYQLKKRFPKTSGSLIIKNAQMLSIYETVKRISDFNTTVMLLGESGTGKEVIAKEIHNLSPRRDFPFMAINCGAIPENLLESELFGHKRGSFTDAYRDKPGLLEQANHGTVFLDEIGELPLLLQAKLLRFLQEREIRRVGGDETIPLDVRIISATLKDLEKDTLLGFFREDLFYRLNVVTVDLPPLRARRDEILDLAHFFIEKKRQKLFSTVQGFSPDAQRALTSYAWPGNIRELENVVERGMVLTDSDIIDLAHLPARLHGAIGDSVKNFGAMTQPNDPLDLADNLSIKHHQEILERRLIEEAMQKTDNNKTQAAKLLEISLRTLVYKIKDYGMGN